MAEKLTNEQIIDTLKQMSDLELSALVKEVEKEFDGKGYGDFKIAVGETVADMLTPLQARHADILKDKEYLDSIVKENVEKAQYYSNKTLRKVQKKVGFNEKVR